MLGDVQAFGGLMGKHAVLLTYTEDQKYGLNNISGSLRAYGPRLAGNQSGDTHGTSFWSDSEPAGTRR